jgi:hypothetical protein
MTGAGYRPVEFLECLFGAGSLASSEQNVEESDTTMLPGADGAGQQTSVGIKLISGFQHQVPALIFAANSNRCYR